MTKCPKCGEKMSLVNGQFYCLNCEHILKKPEEKLDKTLDDDHWIQGRKDDNS